MCEEKSTEKNSAFQMGIEPTNFRTLVGCSTHWELSGEQVIYYRIAQSHYGKWKLNHILSISLN